MTPAGAAVAVAVAWFDSASSLRFVVQSHSSIALFSRPSLPIGLLCRQRHRSLSSTCSRHSISMGSPRKDDGAAKDKGHPTATAPSAKPSSPPHPPPLEPPEKPLPGDCCGSGCVRCVWDVYYEELEAYNKSLESRDKGKQQ